MANVVALPNEPALGSATGASYYYYYYYYYQLPVRVLPRKEPANGSWGKDATTIAG